MNKFIATFIICIIAATVLAIGYVTIVIGNGKNTDGQGVAIVHENNDTGQEKNDGFSIREINVNDTSVPVLVEKSTVIGKVIQVNQHQNSTDLVIGTGIHITLDYVFNPMDEIVSLTRYDTKDSYQLSYIVLDNGTKLKDDKADQFYKKWGLQYYDAFRDDVFGSFYRQCLKLGNDYVADWDCPLKTSYEYNGVVG